MARSGGSGNKGKCRVEKEVSKIVPGGNLKAKTKIEIQDCGANQGAG